MRVTTHGLHMHPMDPTLATGNTDSHNKERPSMTQLAITTTHNSIHPSRHMAEHMVASVLQRRSSAGSTQLFQAEHIPPRSAHRHNALMPTGIGRWFAMTRRHSWIPTALGVLIAPRQEGLEFR